MKTVPIIRKMFSLFLCLIMLTPFASAALAEEMEMLAVEDAVMESGPIAITAPEDEAPAGDISIEDLEASADSMSKHHEAVLATDADTRRALIALCLSTAADFSGEALPIEGLEAFDNLNSSYIVTADKSYEISIPDNFTKSAQSTSTSLVYTHTRSDMVVSVSIMNQTTPDYNYNYLATNGFTANKATYNNIPVVYGLKSSAGKYHWVELFNTTGNTVMLQSLYSVSYATACTALTTEFFTSVKTTASQELIVSNPVFTLSADKKSIFITRPVVTGGTGNYTYAYNIYDSNSNPVNYFYSNEETVAASPGYNGKFNVFIVVSDGQTSKTVDIGWQDITGNDAMSVTSGKWQISADKRSVFIEKPTITGGTRSYTIAYNIYDSNSKPVNYFYSNDAAVAASPGYNGTFNIYIVISDGQTTKTLMTGWFALTGY